MNLSNGPHPSLQRPRRFPTFLLTIPEPGRNPSPFTPGLISGAFVNLCAGAVMGGYWQYTHSSQGR